ncbi:leucine-rich melanocyte differentiation-associated protein-like [Condylostylus longicornis]|uniref:leucine-rich melanocyte differentiation-associated protein-like n=1 Tax=Condylostylus longicornis TaxID=2530218 RepID=UPI00244E35D5|nr:leucine-rich melanocyte differentiation-associated protein-like [Condylostylus longicornis]
MKYYKDIDILSLNENCFSFQEIQITQEEIKYEFERVSLAYRELNRFPRKLALYLGKNIKFLDLTYNNLQNLQFLSNFPLLHTLVLDRNPRLNFKSLPYLPRLQILWLNNCNIINTNDWVLQLKIKCPNIKQLSMMCNPVGLTCLNGISQDQERIYRKEIAELLPTLMYFDGAPVTSTHENSEMGKILKVMYLLRTKWQNIWDFQYLKMLENQKRIV